MAFDEEEFEFSEVSSLRSLSVDGLPWTSHKSPDSNGTYIMILKIMKLSECSIFQSLFKELILLLLQCNSRIASGIDYNQIKIQLTVSAASLDDDEVSNGKRGSDFR